MNNYKTFGAMLPKLLIFLIEASQFLENSQNYCYHLKKTSFELAEDLCLAKYLPVLWISNCVQSAA